MASIIFVRHGETDYNKENRLSSLDEVPLNEKGQEQAKLLGKRLSRVKIGSIYSSPSRRTMETAEEIAKYHPLKIIVDDALKELYFGEWEGKNFAEIRSIDGNGLDKWLNDPANASFPGGENYFDIEKRVRGWLEKVAPGYIRENIAAVTHGGIIGFVVGKILGLKGDAYWRFSMSTASMTAISKTDRGFYIVYLNDTGHLE